MQKNRLHTRSLASLVLALAIGLLLPAESLASALVRFIHGVPGVGRATVDVDGQALGSIAFAQSTEWHSIRSGSFHWALTRGGRTLAHGTATVGTGAYDIVVLEKGAAVSLGIYRTERGRPGTSLVRVIHGAPELGSPELTVDGKEAVHSLAYTQATPYVALPSGTHTLGAMRPGDSAPLVSGTVRLISGDAYSAIVLGTRGERVRVVELTDRGAPLVRHASSISLSAASGTAGNVVVVKPGDSLWAIARRLAGPGADNTAVQAKVVEIWDANAQRIGTGDPNLIFPGTRLHIP